MWKWGVFSALSFNILIRKTVTLFGLRLLIDDKIVQKWKSVKVCSQHSQLSHNEFVLPVTVRLVENWKWKQLRTAPLNSNILCLLNNQIYTESNI